MLANTCSSFCASSLIVSDTVQTSCYETTKSSCTLAQKLRVSLRWNTLFERVHVCPWNLAFDIAPKGGAGSCSLCSWARRRVAATCATGEVGRCACIPDGLLFHRARLNAAWKRATVTRGNDGGATGGAEAAAVRGRKETAAALKAGAVARQQGQLPAPSLGAISL